MDVLNDLQRDDTNSYSKKHGSKEGGGEVRSPRYTGGHTSEGRIYLRLGKTIKEIESNRPDTSIFVVSSDDDWKQTVVNVRGSEFLYPDKLIAVKDPSYILIRDKTSRKPEVTQPRPEFLRIIYDTMVAPNKG